MTTDSEDHWLAVFDRPVRPSAPLWLSEEIRAAYGRAVEGMAGPALVLGATPQLADIADIVTMVDQSADVIALRLPTGRANRTVICADWRHMAFANESYAVCVGDGALNALPIADARMVLEKVAGFLRSGGRAAIRVYLRPESGEGVAEVLAAARSRGIGSFNAFKWRLAMAIAGERGNPDMAVSAIHTRFVAEIGDRAGFASSVGFDATEVDGIDIYRDSDAVYCFPTASEFRGIVPDGMRFAGFLSTGSYELADRCPIAVMERA